MDLLKRLGGLLNSEAEQKFLTREVGSWGDVDTVVGAIEDSGNSRASLHLSFLLVHLPFPDCFQLRVSAHL